ncbi:MAG: fibronectin type III domain-containing protein [Bacteroidales bacterium]|nr:fibronectin type III domain-containing protein [Bacteroidales bacterium]
MKSFKILIAAAMSAALLAGCAQKEVITGIDKSKAGVTDFAYDETMSSTTSVSLVWNPEQALKAGATSFSVQLAKQEDFSDATMYKPEVSMYKDTPQGQTIQADAAVTDGTIFSGLKEYDRYYARIRANYPRSVYSDWTVLKDGDDLACISVGHGLLAMSFSAPKELKLSAPAYSKITASWSMVGKADGYAPEWKKSSDSNWTKLAETTGAQAEITELSEKTSYDVRVRAYRVADGNKEYTDYTTASITTPEKPAFQPNIEDKDQFMMFVSSIAATASATDSYTLEKDIDLGGAELPAIEAFAGKFDGKKHVIKNATIPGNLFGAVSGSFKDVTFSAVKLENSLIGATSESAAISGVVFDKDCSVTFPEPAASTNYGVLVGTNLGSVENCSNAAPVEVKYATLPKESCNWGGLVGYTSGVVKGCSNSGKVALSVDEPGSGTYHCFGGVVGMYDGEAGKSMVANCTNTGNVSVEYGTAVYFYVGGVVGGTPSAKETPGNYGVVENCSNEGNVSMHYISGGSGAYPNIGGVVGYVEGSLKNCTNKGEVSILCDSDSNTWTCPRVAGVGGTVTQGASECHNYGKIGATALFAGGTAGNRGAGNIASGCFAGVIASAGPYVSDGSVVFEKCTNNVDLNLTLGTITETPNSYYGGVFGYVSGTIVDCANNNAVTVTCPTAINRLGGIAGGCKYAVSGCTNKGVLKLVQNSIQTNGKPNWRNFMGGIVADASSAGSVAFTKCVNSGDIDMVSSTPQPKSYTSCLGGIVGCKKSGIELTFTDCSNTGKITYTATNAVTTADMCGGDYN